MESVLSLHTVVWPMVFLLTALIVIHKLGNSIEPIFQGLTYGLKSQAARHSMAWLMALMYASAASLQAMGEVSTQLGWVYVAAFAKVIQPAVVAVIAFLNRPPESKPEKENASKSS